MLISITVPGKTQSHLLNGYYVLWDIELSHSLVSVNPLEFRGNYSATSNNMQLVHWLLMGGLLHLVQRGGTRHGNSLSRPSLLYQM